MQEKQIRMPGFTLYSFYIYVKNIYEVIEMKEKKNEEVFDKNLFKAMNYEYAGEMGIVDNEDMKNNRKLDPLKDKKKDKEKRGKK